MNIRVDRRYLYSFGTWEPELKLRIHSFKTLDPDFWYPGARVLDFKTPDLDL